MEHALHETRQELATSMLTVQQFQSQIVAERQKTVELERFQRSPPTPEELLAAERELADLDSEIEALKAKLKENKSTRLGTQLGG